MAVSKDAHPGFASTRQAAEFFGLSESKVRELAATGEWPSYCIGARRLFDLAEIIRIVKQAPKHNG